MNASYEVTGLLHVVCKCDFCERKREMTLEQTRRMREIAAKACIKFGENYEEVCYAAEEAILAALADPLLDGYAEAQEQAAKVCEHQEADHCAAAIRAMKKECGK